MCVCVHARMHMYAKSLQSCPTLSTLWTVVHQAPLSVGFSRQEYWSELPCLPPGDLPNPEIKPASLMSPALADSIFTTRITWEAQLMCSKCLINISKENGMKVRKK